MIYGLNNDNNNVRGRLCKLDVCQMIMQQPSSHSFQCFSITWAPGKYLAKFLRISGDFDNEGGFLLDGCTAHRCFIPDDQYGEMMHRVQLTCLVY